MNFNFEDDLYIKSIWQPIEDPAEENRLNKIYRVIDPICWAIKVGLKNLSPDTFDNTYDTWGTFSSNGIHIDEIESGDPDNDPYFMELKRLMSCYTVDDPLEGSPQYYKVAQNYALFGKEFLDFPTDNKSLLQESLCPASLRAIWPPPGFDKPSKYTVRNGNQQNDMVIQTNYSNYLFSEAENMIRHLFGTHTQVDTSLFLKLYMAGGTHYCRAYAKMLEQQFQSHQVELMNSTFLRFVAADMATRLGGSKR